MLGRIKNRKSKKWCSIDKFGKPKSTRKCKYTSHPSQQQQKYKPNFFTSRHSNGELTKNCCMRQRKKRLFRMSKKVAPSRYGNEKNKP